MCERKNVDVTDTYDEGCAVLVRRRRSNQSVSCLLVADAVPCCAPPPHQTSIKVETVTKRLYGPTKDAGVCVVHYVCTFCNTAGRSRPEFRLLYDLMIRSSISRHHVKVYGEHNDDERGMKQQ